MNFRTCLYGSMSSSFLKIDPSTIRLVIFPMSGNNTFEHQILQTYASLFKATTVPSSLPQCL